MSVLNEVSHLEHIPDATDTQTDEHKVDALRLPPGAACVIIFRTPRNMTVYDPESSTANTYSDFQKRGSVDGSKRTKLKSKKTDILGSIGKQSGRSVKSVPKKKKKNATLGKIGRNAYGQSPGVMSDGTDTQFCTIIFAVVGV